MQMLFVGHCPAEEKGVDDGDDCRTNSRRTVKVPPTADGVGCSQDPMGHAPRHDA